MKISRLKASNFKSFDTLDVELGDLNVFIGPNASGKSNLLSLLTFFRDVARDGVEDAVSLQSGDISLLSNAQLNQDLLRVAAEWGYGIQDPGHPPDFGWKAFLTELEINLSGLSYELDLKHEGSRFHLSNEAATWAGYARTPTRDEDPDFRTFPLTPQKPVDPNQHPPHTSSQLAEDTNKITSLFHRKSRGLLADSARTAFAQLRTFDFTGGNLTGVSSSQGKSHLEEDGSNIALVLRSLLRDEEKKRKFLNLIGTLLPFVRDLDIDQFTGQSLLLKLQETYAKDTYLPASLLSDGTVQIVALLIALYFDERLVVAFEEPARSLHPKLISQLMQMMKEVSQKKQIFVTTHNPEVVKHAGLDNVYLVRRDDDGFSRVSKPADKKTVQIFLENELGVDDLLVQDLL